MNNEYQKYWKAEPRDWHENIIGIYHISRVGCSHQDMKYDEHSGPCLRETYWDYTDSLPNSDETEGNFDMGKDIHKRLQEIIKEWKPNTVIEDPLAKIFEKGGQKILITGSIDVLYKHLFDLIKDTAKTKKKISIWDIKSASQYTMPKSKYDKSPTHFDQVDIYAIMKILFDLHPDHNEIKRVKIIYVSKHNKRTITQRNKFKLDEAMDKFVDFIERAFYLHNCLNNEIVPIPEPHKWCKFCKYLKRCIEQGDVKPIMKGKKTPKLVGLEVKSIE